MLQLSTYIYLSKTDQLGTFYRAVLFITFFDTQTSH